MKKKSKGYSMGGATKSRTSKPKTMSMGKKVPKMMASGKETKMPMSKDPRTGQMVPSFTVDGKGKMMGGGKTMNMMTSDGVKMSPKMMANGGATMMDRKNGGNTVARGSGAARTQKFTKNG